MANFRKHISSSATIAQVDYYVAQYDINEIFMRMTEELFMVQPEHPLRFILDYVSLTYKGQVDGNYFKSEAGKWEYIPPKKNVANSDMGTDEDEESDEILLDSSSAVVTKRDGRRASVFAGELEVNLDLDLESRDTAKTRTELRKLCSMTSCPVWRTADVDTPFSHVPMTVPGMGEVIGL